MANLIIHFIKTGEIELKLMKGQKLIDALTFYFEANLDTVLISTVDKIFKRNRINPLSLKTIKVAGNVEKESSAYKIAATFREALLGVVS